MSIWSDRPTYEKITRDVIDSISDDLLVGAIFDHIWLKVGQDYPRTYQILAALPPGFSVVFYIITLDGEIGNGGFNQYFFNGLDNYAEQQLAALELIEAIQHKYIFQQAFKIHDDEKQNQELQHRYEERTIEAFFSTYEITELGECDEAWYALDQELDALLIRFIRTYPELFII